MVPMNHLEDLFKKRSCNADFFVDGDWPRFCAGSTPTSRYLSFSVYRIFEVLGSLLVSSINFYIAKFGNLVDQFFHCMFGNSPSISLLRASRQETLLLLVFVVHAKHQLLL